MDRDAAALIEENSGLKHGLFKRGKKGKEEIKILK
jgi:hypothetical protein